MMMMISISILRSLLLQAELFRMSLKVPVPVTPSHTRHSVYSAHVFCNQTTNIHVYSKMHFCIWSSQRAKYIKEPSELLTHLCGEEGLFLSPSRSDHQLLAPASPPLHIPASVSLAFRPERLDPQNRASRQGARTHHTWIIYVQLQSTRALGF